MTMTNSEIIKENYAEAVKGIKEEWFTSTNSKWYEYIIELPIQLQITYVIVVLHNQVLNGGFHQYFINGYGQFAKEAIKALITIGALKKAELLKKALDVVNIENDIDVVFRERLLKRDIPELFVTDNLFEPLEKLDDQYYAEEDIEHLLSTYLRGH